MFGECVPKRQELVGKIITQNGEIGKADGARKVGRMGQSGRIGENWERLGDAEMEKIEKTGGEIEKNRRIGSEMEKKSRR